MKETTEINLYVDVLFFVNFIMDLLVLSMVRRIMKYPMIWWRIFLGAVLGALWAVFTAAFSLLPLWTEVGMTYLMISTLMVMISFPVKKIKEILKLVVALYVITATTAGIMYALYQHTKTGYYIEQILNAKGGSSLSFYQLMFLLAGIYFGLRYLLWWILGIWKDRNNLFEVTMRYKGREKQVVALLDTGNRLYEPVSHKAVHVVTYEAVRDICETVTEVIYIPFGSVGKSSGIMPGIFLDEMEIRQGDKIKIMKKPLIAVCKRSLSVNGEYQMLLHEE